MFKSNGILFNHESTRRGENFISRKTIIGLIKNGDIIKIASSNNKLQLKVSKKDLLTRKRRWKKPSQKHLSGAIYKYSVLVSSASQGAITDGKVK